MKTLTVYSSATAWAAAALAGEGRTRSKDGYICYATSDAPSNAGASYPGFGFTEKQAFLNACYWSNQMPWVRIVPYSKAPLWAQEEVMRRALMKVDEKL